MPLPAGNQTTVDVYRAGGGPPSAPDLSGVQGVLRCVFPHGHEPAEGIGGAAHTHIFDTALDNDIRDGAQTPGTPGNDILYVPDKDGTPFDVIYVGKVGDIRRCWLMRGSVSYPTSNL